MITEKKLLLDLRPLQEKEEWACIKGKFHKEGKVYYSLVSNKGRQFILDKAKLDFEIKLRYVLEDTHKIITVQEMRNYRIVAKIIIKGEKEEEILLPRSNDIAWGVLNGDLEGSWEYLEIPESLKKRYCASYMYAPIKLTEIKTDDNTIGFQVFGLEWSTVDRKGEVYLQKKEVKTSFYINTKNFRVYGSNSSNNPKGFKTYTYTGIDMMFYKCDSVKDEVLKAISKELGIATDGKDYALDIHKYFLSKAFPLLSDREIERMRPYFKGRMLPSNLLALQRQSKAEDMFQLAYELLPNIPRTKKVKGYIRKDGLLAIAAMRCLRNALHIKDINRIYTLMDNANGNYYRLPIFKGQTKIRNFFREYAKICGEKKMCNYIARQFSMDDYRLIDTIQAYNEIIRRAPEVLYVNGKHVFSIYKQEELHDILNELLRELGRENITYTLPKTNCIEAEVDGFTFAVAKETKDLVSIAAACKNCVVTHEHSILYNGEYIVGVKNNADNIVACISGIFKKEKFQITEAKERFNYPLCDSLYRVVTKWMEEKEMTSITGDISEHRSKARFAGNDYHTLELTEDGKILQVAG